MAKNNWSLFDKIEELEDIKFLLTQDLAIPFNTNIMKIALNFMEEKIAR